MDFQTGSSRKKRKFETVGAEKEAKRKAVEPQAQSSHKSPFPIMSQREISTTRRRLNRKISVYL